MEVSHCHKCGGAVRKHGSFRDVPRVQCIICGATQTGTYVSCSPFYPSRTPVGKCVQILQLVEGGMTMRRVAIQMQVKKDTVANILRCVNYKRRCRTCGTELPPHKIAFCSDACQAWKNPRAIIEGTAANVTKIMQERACNRHVAMAWIVAESINVDYADHYLAPAYEGIADGCLSGIIDEDELIALGKASIKKYWKETRSFGQSLEELKEATAWEPGGY